MTMFALIFLGTIALVITTIIDSGNVRHNQAWLIIHICLLSVALVAFTVALFMAFE